MLNSCKGLNSGEISVNYESSTHDQLMKEVATKKENYDTFFDTDGINQYNYSLNNKTLLSQYNTEGTELSKRLTEIKNQILGLEKIDRIVMNYQKTKLTSFQFFEQYITSITDYSFDWTINTKDKRVFKFKNYQVGKAEGACKKSLDTWKIYKKSCISKNSKLGVYVNLKKDPTENFGKKTCLSFEDFDTVKIKQRYNEKAFAGCKVIDKMNFYDFIRTNILSVDIFRNRILSSLVKSETE